MKSNPQTKTLIIIISVLLLANIATLTFFLLKNKQEKKWDDKKNYASEYLQKELGFSKSQLVRFDSLSNIHKVEMKATYNRFLQERRPIFNEVAAESFSDSSINEAALKINVHQKIFQVNMLRNIRSIRDICDEDQRRRFDTSFYKILGRGRGDLKAKN